MYFNYRVNNFWENNNKYDNGCDVAYFSVRIYQLFSTLDMLGALCVVYLNICNDICVNLA